MLKSLFGLLATLAMLAGCAQDRTQEVEPERDTSMERREPEPSRDIPGGRLPEEGVEGEPMTSPDFPPGGSAAGSREDKYGPPPAETTAGEQPLGEPIKMKQQQGEQQQQDQPQQQNQPGGQQ